MTNIAKHIFFAGRVQGVGFRFTAEQVAMRCKLTGFVRNTSDGRVEMFVQGRAEDVDYAIEDLQQAFTVRNTEVEQVEFDSSYDDFRITF